MSIAPATDTGANLLARYVAAHSSSLGAFVLEEILDAGLSWIPTPVGMGVRSLAWAPILRGALGAGIERGVILKHTREITLGDKVYLDRRVSLHGGMGGLTIGARTRVMFGAAINVYNFRRLAESGVHIGPDCVVGAFSVITGQGGVTIGANTIIGPRVTIVPVNHHFRGDAPIREQGLELQGIAIDDNVWIGAGAIVLDGVHIGSGSVIGAGAVVTHDIPAGAVATGNPARVQSSVSEQAAAGG